ncbi:hypothetical protein PCASD_10308 [Puccinia coronata f. sp. avenae]|uniref:Uncharacterized protein n=1 Tax=Puccinia coronata f. sp. avenae TaxID=200324 RepID=A0A2N5U7G4_9BASI|nr:hypothetical protein PCASD_10308 [Puccinia coronata f. sp. avenae]
MRRRNSEHTLQQRATKGSLAQCQTDQVSVDQVPCQTRKSSARIKSRTVSSGSDSGHEWTTNNSAECQPGKASRRNSKPKPDEPMRRTIKIHDKDEKLGNKNPLQRSPRDSSGRQSRSKASPPSGRIKSRPLSSDSESNSDPLHAFRSHATMANQPLRDSASKKSLPSDLPAGQSKSKRDVSNGSMRPSAVGADSDVGSNGVDSDGANHTLLSSGAIKSRTVDNKSDSSNDVDFTCYMARDINKEHQFRVANKGKTRPRAFVPTLRGMEDEDDDEKIDQEAVKAMKWRPKKGKPPEHMTASVAAQQKKYNPLIKLLGIQIKIIRSDGEEDAGIMDPDCIPPHLASSDSESSFGSESDSHGIKKQKQTSSSPQESDEDHELPTTSDNQDGELSTTGDEHDELSTTGDEDDELSTTENEDEPPKMPLAKNPLNLILTSPRRDDSSSFNPPPQEADNDDELSTTGSEDGPFAKRVTKDPKANNKETRNSPHSQQREETDYADDELPSTCSEDAPPSIQSEAKPEARSSIDVPSVLRTKADQAPSPTPLKCSQPNSVHSNDDSLKRTARDLTPSIPSKRPKREVTYPRVQSESRPNFEISSEDQDVVGALILSESVQLTGSINKFLKPYQRDGVKFFFKHFQERNGVVLGDDMGLGKTIQVIAFLSAVMGLQGTPDEHNRRKNAINRLPIHSSHKPCELGPTCLVICPNTVIDNWAHELKTWGYFEHAVLSGKKASTETIPRFNQGAFDILICGHNFARDHIDELYDLDFTIVVVDEAHVLKESTSAITKAFHKFETKIRFGLTGTVMQNKLSELHSIFNWVRPGVLGTPAMWKAFVANPILHAQKSNASVYERHLGNQRSTALVRNCWPDLQLRRTKSKILHELPPRTDQIALCPMTPMQKLAHANLLSDPEVANMRNYDKPCHCKKKDKKGRPYALRFCCDPQWSKRIFPYLTLFRKVANHLALTFPSKQDTSERYEQDGIYMEKMFPNGTAFRDHFSAKYDVELCGKWKVLKPLLDQWKKDQCKVLLFSQSTQMMDILEYWLQQDFPEFVRLDGSVATRERYKRVEEFQTDPNLFIFLASVRAAGVGLNLTAANKVVIFDPSWNPSQDAQAMDRVVRIGQKREVECIRLISSGTTEELIYHRQIYKQGLSEVANTGKASRRHFTGVQGDKKNQGDIFGAQNMFKGPVDEQASLDPEENADDFSYALNHVAVHGTLVANTKSKDEFQLIPLEALPQSAPTDRKSAEALLRDAGVEKVLRTGEVVQAALPTRSSGSKLSQASNKPRYSGVRSVATQPPLRGAKLKAKLEKKKSKSALGSDVHSSSSDSGQVTKKDFASSTSKSIKDNPLLKKFTSVCPTRPRTGPSDKLSEDLARQVVGPTCRWPMSDKWSSLPARWVIEQTGSTTCRTTQIVLRSSGAVRRVVRPASRTPRADHMSDVPVRPIPTCRTSTFDRTSGRTSCPTCQLVGQFNIMG